MTGFEGKQRKFTWRIIKQRLRIRFEYRTVPLFRAAENLNRAPNETETKTQSPKAPRNIQSDNLRSKVERFALGREKFARRFADSPIRRFADSLRAHALCRSQSCVQEGSPQPQAEALRSFERVQRVITSARFNGKAIWVCWLLGDICLFLVFFFFFFFFFFFLNL